MPLLAIFLVANCLASVTASGSPDFYSGTPVTVTPVDGRHLSLDYQKSVNIDYNQVKDVMIRINVSI